MANHSKPEITDNYTDVLSQIRGRFEDQAKGFDPANTSATNIPTNSIRWTSVSNKWQKWNGTSWVDLSSLYAINISGNAGTVTNGVYITGNQTVNGTKTFSNTIQGSISGNSGTVTNGVYTIGNQTITGVKTFSDNTIINGNIGVGTNLSPWNFSGLFALQIKSAGFFGFGDNAYMGANEYIDSTGNGRYINSTFATEYRQTAGQHRWYTAPSGIAGQPISFTQVMTLDSNGKLILSVANQGIQFADSTTQTTAYSPTGSGASGTWGISITGNAATATSATNATNATNAGNANTVNNKIVDSGSYTPTLSNISSGLTLSSQKAQWIRIGNVVSVTFEASVTTTSATVNNFSMSLPLTASLSGTIVGGGVGGDVVSGTTQSAIFGRVAVTTSTQATGIITTSHAQSYKMCVTFSYTAA
jgi:hypothetical protein